MADRPPKVVMLGWEFPPFITGGLGTACHGLTKALDSLGAQVTFVLPKGVAGDHASHVELLAPGLNEARGPELRAGGGPAPAGVERRKADRGVGARTVAAAAAIPTTRPAPPKPDPVALRAQLGRAIRLVTAPFVASGAYENPAARVLLERLATASAAPPRLLRPGVLAEAAAAPASEGDELLHGLDEPSRQEVLSLLEAWERYGAEDPGAVAEMVEMIRAVRSAVPESNGRGAGVSLRRGGTAPDYSGDLLAQSEAYARFVVERCRDMDFDVIHAHDWLTYPAGIALARVTGRPLVVHVHSTEFDRSGEHVNQAVYNIERRGMHAAVKVVTVSMLTRNICANRYAVPVAKCDVVYNGVDLDPRSAGLTTIGRRDRIVLYFGRITMQKGPEYFVQAAKRVLEKVEDVKFVVAGSGDQAQRMISLAAELGIGHKVLFTGFLRGKDIPRVFSMADLYVMPSVSEPFGIAPLEALGHRVPVLISRQSGVSEVLVNALKVDFWDVDDMANKIIAVLRHPPLQRTLVDHGFDEVRGLTWEGAAKRCISVYRGAMQAVGTGARR
ncbi:MAG: glycosyltransferase [Phycisphaerales bacterium]|nr:glycosyltransferase [Phycisphaerales bacterium]